MPSNVITVLFLGDTVGKPGREAAVRYLKQASADFKIVNGENLAGGIGITPSLAMEILEAGADAITTGNHVWKKKEVIPYLMMEPRVVRPLNYPPGTPGFGYTLIARNGKSLYVANIEGRTFMGTLSCPFRAMEEFLEEKHLDVPAIVDFHAEATSEKVAMGWYLDGQVSALVGTHTHVRTGDAHVLPGGTAYMTDVGMCGPRDSVIGVKKELVIERFLTQLPVRFEVADGNVWLEGVAIELGADGHALSITPFEEPA